MLDNNRYMDKAGDLPHKHNRADLIGGASNHEDSTAWDTLVREIEEEISYYRYYSRKFPARSLSNTASFVVPGRSLGPDANGNMAYARDVLYHVGVADTALTVEITALCGIRNRIKPPRNTPSLATLAIDGEVHGMNWVPIDTFIECMDGDTKKNTSM